MSLSPVLRLASASPRRRQLLAQIGVPHAVEVADVDERAGDGEACAAYVERVARAKAQAVWQRAHDLPVLGADTTVVLDGVSLGKPRDRAHGLSMLAALAGREHQVLTAVALVTVSGTRCITSASTVRMRASTSQERIRYWETGEPHDKAGGYAIQGLGAIFIETLRGSFSGVMGLPLFETAQLLAQAGLPCWSVA
ncbi:MAG TPA: Maf family protein [Steroidobacteraceae bacterium]|jgi:septum formation protein